MRVFDISGIIHIPQATFVPNFVSVVASIVELDHGENRVLNQSFSHSPSLFDAPGIKAFASENHVLQPFLREHTITAYSLESRTRSEFPTNKT